MMIWRWPVFCVHRLAGSAGTFGFPELGKLARQLAIALKPLAEALATDPDGTVRAEPIARVVNAEFLREVDRLVQWLSEEGDRDDASAVTTEPGRAPVARAAEPVVLVVALLIRRLRLGERRKDRDGSDDAVGGGD